MVDRKSIDDMARIMALLEGAPAATAEVPRPVASAASADPVGRAVVNTPDVEQMKTILKSFYKATALNEGIIDKELDEAMITEQTKTGARIGDYEIVVQNEGRLKTYDVMLEGKAIVEGLSLLEAARGIIRILNRGGDIADADARSLLELEGQYYRHLSDAIVFKHREKALAEAGNYTRAAVMADRYSDVRTRALAIRESIGRATKRLR